MNKSQTALKRFKLITDFNAENADKENRNCSSSQPNNSACLATNDNRSVSRNVAAPMKPETSQQSSTKKPTKSKLTAAIVNAQLDAIMAEQMNFQNFPRKPEPKIASIQRQPEVHMPQQYDKLVVRNLGIANKPMGTAMQPSNHNVPVARVNSQNKINYPPKSEPEVAKIPRQPEIYQPLDSNKLIVKNLGYANDPGTSQPKTPHSRFGKPMTTQRKPRTKNIPVTIASKAVVGGNVNFPSYPQKPEPETSITPAQYNQLIADNLGNGNVSKLLGWTDTKGNVAMNTPYSFQSAVNLLKTKIKNNVPKIKKTNAKKPAARRKKAGRWICLDPVVKAPNKVETEDVDTLNYFRKANSSYYPPSVTSNTDANGDTFYTYFDGFDDTVSRQKTPARAPYKRKTATPKKRNVTKSVSLTVKGEDIIVEDPVLRNYHQLATNYPHTTRDVDNQEEAVANEEEFENNELGELTYNSAYSEYIPSRLAIGRPHPFTVVESRSLSTMLAPEIRYESKLPIQVVDKCVLSNVQLEAVIYSCQKHEEYLNDGRRAGFLIGDGAGVGKGRTVAGIIYENYLLGRKKAIWVSVSSDLKIDAKRDLCDIGKEIGLEIPVKAINKMNYAPIDSKENGHFSEGILFVTYSSLISQTSVGGRGRKNMFKTRLEQIIDWFGMDFDGVIIFDESHKAKNLHGGKTNKNNIKGKKTSKTGAVVKEIQDILRHSRVVYASATGATEPKHMAYMVRLGLWGPENSFKEFDDFEKTLTKNGVGAMELIAIEMKMKGVYLSRQLSFRDVLFEIQEIRVDDSLINGHRLRDVYDRSVKLWTTLHEDFNDGFRRNRFDSRAKMVFNAQYWSSHQRFFKYMCMSAKIKECVRVINQQIENGNCVVLGLQSTGEARTMGALEETGGDLVDFVSSAKGVLKSLIKSFYPSKANLKRYKDKLRDKAEKAGVSGLKEELGDVDPGEDLEVVRRKASQARRSNMKKETSLKGLYDDDDDNDDNKDFVAYFRDSQRQRENRRIFAEINDGTVLGSYGYRQSDHGGERVKRGGRNSIKTEPRSNLNESVNLTEIKKDSSWGNNLMVMPGDSDFEVEQVVIPAKNSRAAPVKGRMRGNFNEFPHKKEEQVIVKDELADNLPETRKDASVQKRLWKSIASMGNMFPVNVLDQLIHDLGGPSRVAEMTGRKGRMVEIDGSVGYRSRKEAGCSLEQINILEKNRFNSGEKLIGIISDAASTGISLHSDKRFRNQRQRVHITLELPWSADKAIQQFGRTHRSNQIVPPRYIFLISDLAGERRFAATVAKRLESLGALTHGDRRCADTKDLSQFNIDNAFGLSSVTDLVTAGICKFANRVPYPMGLLEKYGHDQRRLQDAIKQALNNVGIEDFESISVPKFLNRILGLELDMQNGLFQYFLNIVDYKANLAKARNEFDHGIRDMMHTQDIIYLENTHFMTLKSASDIDHISVHKVINIAAGVSWEVVLERFKRNPAENRFYILKRGSVKMLVMAEHQKKDEFKLITVQFPAKTISRSSLRSMYEEVGILVAKKQWMRIYVESENKCMHVVDRGGCVKLNCIYGKRTKINYIITGSVFLAWEMIRQVFRDLRMEIIRVEAQDGMKLIGALVYASKYRSIMSVLEKQFDCVNIQVYDTNTIKDQLQGKVRNPLVT